MLTAWFLLPTLTFKHKHTHTFFKEDTTKPIVWKEKKKPSSRRGETRRGTCQRGGSCYYRETSRNNNSIKHTIPVQLLPHNHSNLPSLAAQPPNKHTQSHRRTYRGGSPLTNAGRDTAASQRPTRLASFYTSLMWSSSGGIRRLTSIKQTRRTMAENNLSEMLIY